MEGAGWKIEKQGYKASWKWVSCRAKCYRVPDRRQGLNRVRGSLNGAANGGWRAEGKGEQRQRINAEERGEMCKDLRRGSYRLLFLTSTISAFPLLLGNLSCGSYQLPIQWDKVILDNFVIEMYAYWTTELLNRGWTRIENSVRLFFEWISMQ